VAGGGGEGVTVWLAGLAFGECDPEAALAVLAREGDEAAYRCAIDEERAGGPLVAAIRALPADDDAARPRFTRALALRLATTSGFWDPELVRLLSPADRRLLADAVKARRGRRSPSPEHDVVFARQPWYHPDEGYTDKRLSEIDRANFELANDPSAFAAEPAEPAPPPVAASPPPGCTCRTAPAPRSPLALLLLAYGVAARSRIANCTRRFAARPSSAALSAIGRVAP
jgi:MYXO-CTERM domain-containing protein